MPTGWTVSRDCIRAAIAVARWSRTASGVFLGDHPHEVRQSFEFVYERIEKVTLIGLQRRPRFATRFCSPRARIVIIDEEVNNHAFVVRLVQDIVPIIELRRVETIGGIGPNPRITPRGPIAAVGFHGHDVQGISTIKHIDDARAFGG